jgi:hypothetical protein
MKSQMITSSMQLPKIPGFSPTFNAPMAFPSWSLQNNTQNHKTKRIQPLQISGNVKPVPIPFQMSGFKAPGTQFNTSTAPAPKVCSFFV